MKLLVLMFIVLASTQVFARSPVLDCKISAHQMALDEVSNLTGEPAWLVADYTDLLESNNYQSTYSILITVDRTDYTVVLTVENKSCQKLGSYAYQSSFN